MTATRPTNSISQSSQNEPLLHEVGTSLRYQQKIESLIAATDDDDERESLFALFISCEANNRDAAISALDRNLRYVQYLRCDLLAPIEANIAYYESLKEGIDSKIRQHTERIKAFCSEHSGVLFPRYASLNLPSGATIKKTTRIIEDSNYPIVQVPEEFKTYPKTPEPKLNKSRSGALYKALKNGETFPFAELDNDFKLPE